MKSFVVAVVLISLSLAVNCQRGSYLGVRPFANGVKGPFPEAVPTGLNNRFGEDDSNSINTVVQPLPIDALGNYHLVQQLNQRPQNQQPFWLLNYQQIEAHRNQPQLSSNPFAQRGSFMGQGRRS